MQKAMPSRRFLKTILLISATNLLLALAVSFPPFTFQPVKIENNQQQVLGETDTLKVSPQPSYDSPKTEVNESVPVKLDPQIVPKDQKPLNNDLWSLLQAWRKSEGHSIYTKSKEICDFASYRGEKVLGNLSGNNDPHAGFEEDLNGFFDAYCHGSCQGAENVVWDYSNPQEALDTWLNSDGHRKNLEADYKYSCLVDYGRTAVQLFANY